MARKKESDVVEEEQPKEQPKDLSEVFKLRPDN